MTGRTIRKAASLAAAVLMLVSCSRQGEIRSPADAQKEIVLIAKGEGEFWSTVKMGAEAAAKEFNVKLTYEIPKKGSGAGGQIDLVNRYLAYGADAIVIAAIDYGKLAESADKADRRGVPVIAIESEIDSDKVRSFVGIDNYEAGRQAARKMKELAGVQGRFLILGDVEGSRNADQRKRGILDEWAGDRGMTVEGAAVCGAVPSQCGEAAKKLLEGDEPVSGILALHAAAAAGAAERILQMGKLGQIKIVGFDNSPEELEWLQEGVVQATVIQNPFSIGYLGVKTAVEAVEGKSVEKRIDTGTKVIDAESMFWSDNQKMLFPFVQ